MVGGQTLTNDTLFAEAATHDCLSGSFVTNIYGIMWWQRAYLAKHGHRWWERTRQVQYAVVDCYGLSHAQHPVFVAVHDWLRG